jgi:FkbM family methyltransferase
VIAALRSIIPPSLRSRLRRSGLMNRYLRYRYAGIRSAPHPVAPFQLHFDGYRNIGWSLGGLAGAETESFAYARQLLDQRKPSCVWDIGANVGLWTLFFAGYQPQIETILAFEPDPINRKILGMNIERNGIGHVKIQSEALSDKAGVMRFMSDPMTGSTGTLEQGMDFIGHQYGAKQVPIEVTVSTADEMIARGLPAPGMMKIDVEGHELSLFQGAQQLLQTVRPAIIFECTRNPEQVGSLLAGFGYRFYDIEHQQPVAAPVFSTAAICS